MPIGKVWISFTVCLFVCVFVFVGLRISPAMIKLAASNFARWFIDVLGPGQENKIFNKKALLNS